MESFGWERYYGIRVAVPNSAAQSFTVAASEAATQFC
jgi:hypothetical protein